jgi:hypothetical protein
MSFTHFLKISHISKSSSNFVIFLIFALLTLVYISVVLLLACPGFGYYRSWFGDSSFIKPSTP